MAFGTINESSDNTIGIWFQSLFFWNGLWDFHRAPPYSLIQKVSILVFLEWPLGLHRQYVQYAQSSVSILVFLEWPLGPELGLYSNSPTRAVSILVFLEWPLGRKDPELINQYGRSFNPCFSGMAFGTQNEFDALVSLV